MDWEGITDRVCYEGLVHCFLPPSTDYATFLVFVTNRSGTIFNWEEFGSGKSKFGIVEIPGTADLATEATAYDESSLTICASPIIDDEGEVCFPDDVLFDSDQWYLDVTENNRPEGGDWDADIDWRAVVNGEGWQRGSLEVRLGSMDLGIAGEWDGEEEEFVFTHGDLCGDRFINGGEYLSWRRH